MTKSNAGHPSGAPHSSVSSPFPPRRRIHRRPRWRLPIAPLVIALISLSGVALLLYPVAASWLSAVEQAREIDSLTQDITDLGAETLRQNLVEARAYNQSLSGGGAAVAANERLPLADDEQVADRERYSSLLRGDAEGLMARIRIPAIDVDLPIFHGTSDAVLERGVGHLEGTALPVGGPSTHSVLTGHRGLASAELFTHLDRVDVGDTFTIEVYGEVVTYRVRETLVVEPEDTQSLLVQPGQDLLTLVTCTPLGINTHRILVTGERVIPTPQSDVDAAGESPDVAGFPWWAIAAGGAVVAAGMYVWWAGRPARGAWAPVVVAGEERDRVPADL
ncbi:class C sortase [Rathayibacter sp. AY1C6]|uniref:class C sortase n=1 Tax=Rathayibacter sp. AY1C6 TaxID=2080539 RepID=UPI001CA4D890|nr:class C sortase [Rathayibacter sp. AY1C6]